MRLKDEVAIITGSTKGLGRAMAERFAREGAQVVVSGRSEDVGKELAQAIQVSGGEAHYVRADVSREEDVRELVRQTVDQFGKLTILVNNAAPTELFIGPTAIDNTICDITTERWNEILNVTLNSVFWGCKYATPEIAKAGGGSIVNVSSMLGIVGVAGVAAYSAAKAGMQAITRSVAVESAAHNVRCNDMAVGVVPIVERTDDLAATRQALMANELWGEAIRKVQLTRVGTPEDIANFALFLASREAEYITGHVFPVEGGALAKAALPEMSTSVFDSMESNT